MNFQFLALYFLAYMCRSDQHFNQDPVTTTREVHSQVLLCFQGHSPYKQENHIELIVQPDRGGSTFLKCIYGHTHRLGSISSDFRASSQSHLGDSLQSFPGA